MKKAFPEIKNEDKVLSRIYSSTIVTKGKLSLAILKGDVPDWAKEFMMGSGGHVPHHTWGVDEALCVIGKRLRGGKNCNSF